MGARADEVGSGPRTVDELLPLALSRPREALAEARAVLAGRPDPYQACVAHQAAAIVLREFGDIEAAVRELGQALALARRIRSSDREADVLATLGVALVYAGRTSSGLTAFDRALRAADGVLAGRILARRGMALWALGRYAAAMTDLRRAVIVLRRAGDDLWTARAINARATVYLALGSTSRADADFAAAELLYARMSQQLESVYSVHNRAVCAFQSGDLPAALAHFDTAASRYRLLSVSVPALSIDRCAVLLAAGLVRDALAEATSAVRDIERTRGQATAKAELLLMAATCALAADQPQAAMDMAQGARRLFRSAQSAWWQAHAASVLVEARYAARQASAQLLREAERVVADLGVLGSHDVARAHLLAGRLALDLGRGEDAERHFLTVARSRLRGPALGRASGWLGAALQAEAVGQTRGLLFACRKGLEALEEHRLTLGASELRAWATTHGAELAALANRHAMRARQPRLLLAWSERCRATALAVPAVLPGHDAELNASLTALRANARRLDKARLAAPSAALQGEQARLEREQIRLERVARSCALRARGTYSSHGTIDIVELLRALGTAQLVEIVDVDGVLQVLLCGAGMVRQFTGGTMAEAAQCAAFARFALRRLARCRPGDDLSSALAILTSAGPGLARALLGPAARHLGDGPVIIVPPAKLHAIPWTLLPELHDRAVSVAPSARVWMRAQAAAPPTRRHVTLARGPGLSTGGAEVPELARLYDDVTVLAGADATAGRVLDALDGAWLAHIAAHGTFRSDSPMFSALRMHDGPLTVYDFEQLRRAPYRLILPSCDSAILAPAGTDELLGLVASLLPLGTAGIVAAIVPLNDRAVVPVMVELHQRLRDGQTIADSMRAIRCGSADDPLQQATAMSLLALGAG